MNIEVNKFNKILLEASNESKTRFLDTAKDKEKLQLIAEKANLMFPNPDLAFFETVFALIDVANKNGAIIPLDEVEKSLKTLNGKPVDIDHIRKSVIGFMISGEMVDNKIIAYGAIFKNSFPEDFKIIQELMNNNALHTSFEAWCDREDVEDGNYKLKNIVWAGNGILIDTQPAFEECEVLEIAKERVLEFASHIKNPKNFIREKSNVKVNDKKEKYLELSRFFVSETETMVGLLNKTECPSCGEPYSQEIDMIDYVNGIMTTSCYMCESKNKVSMTPRVEVSKEIPLKFIKIEKLESVEILEVEKAKVEEIKSSFITEEENKMEEKIKELEAKITELSSQLEAKNAEVAALTAQVSEVKTQVEAANATVETLKQEKEVAVTKAREQATLVANRKAELGTEYAKDLSDEDILDDIKFENAKLKKEVAELKIKASVTPAVASVTPAVTTPATPLAVGAKETAESDISKKQKRVREFAFGA